MLGRGVMTLVAEGILPEDYSGLERNNGGRNNRCGPRCPILSAQAIPIAELATNRLVGWLRVTTSRLGIA